MTYKDKPKGPGGKSFDRERKPAPVGKKTQSGERPAGRDRAEIMAEAAAHAGDDLKPERISKIMARAGVASRRDCERLIMEGRVKLNGVVLDTPAVTCTLADHIEVDDIPIRGIERTRLWLYHKTAGLVTTNSDPEGRPTVFQRLPRDLPRVLSIGRLDINTEGLLLLTNDGGLARVLELPATGWLRRYRVRAHGSIDQAQLDTLRDGIAVDGVLYAGIEAILDRVQGHNVWITMGLREGKNREIKHVLGALGLDVNRLIRISYGPFQLGELGEGEVMEVRSRMLRDQLGPRLIEQAKANFEAPILTVAAAEEEKEPAAERQDVREERGFREKPEDRRERALARLDTKRPDFKAHDERKPRDRDERGRYERAGSMGAHQDRPRKGPREDRKFGDRPGTGRDSPAGRDQGDKFGDRGASDDKPKRPPLGTIRTVNIWRAPGARPLADDKEHMTGDVMSRGKKVTVTYKEKDPNAPPEKPKARKSGFGKPKPGPERPGFSTEPRGERKPYGDRPRSDGPRSDGPRGPRGDAPRSDRPQGDRPWGDKPRGRASEGRFDGKSSAGKSYGKPTGGRPSGDRPGGSKPFGGKPSGGKPSGGPGRGPNRGADRRR